MLCLNIIKYTGGNYEQNRAFLKALGMALSDLLKMKTPQEKYLIERIRRLEEENKLLRGRINELRKSLLELASIVKK